MSRGRERAGMPLVYMDRQKGISMEIIYKRESDGYRERDVRDRGIGRHRGG